MPFTESAARFVEEPTAADVNCKDGCWLTNSTYWSATKVCVELAMCPGFYVEGDDKICVQECPHVQLKSRECRERCPTGQFTDVNRVCTTVCSTNAYKISGQDLNCVDLDECPYYELDSFGQLVCYDGGCPAGYRIFDSSAEHKRCVKRCPFFETGSEDTVLECVSACAEDEYWEYTSEMTTRCVPDCNHMGAIDVEARQCV